MASVKKILLIDDSSHEHRLFKMALAEIDPRIIYVGLENGEVGLQWLSNNLHDLPDIVFLDLNMPRMGGRECLTELRKIPELQSLPVIIYTTSSLSSEIDEMKALGATMFCTKPLYQHITKVLKAIIYPDTLETSAPVIKEHIFGV
jgi:CheY-like chemotaxis protein